MNMIMTYEDFLARVESQGFITLSPLFARITILGR